MARHLIHRGSVMAWGIWFPPGFPGSRALLQRVLEMWVDGSTLGEISSLGYLLRFPQPRRVQSRQCPGLPLVACGGGWSSYPRQEPLGLDQLALCWQGRLLEVPRSQLRPCDVALWLKDFFAEVVEGQPLASPAGPPMVAPPPIFTVREELPSVPPPSPKLQILLDRWHQQSADAKPATLGSGGLFASPAQAGPLLQWAASAWSKLSSIFAPTHNQRYLKEMVNLFESGNLSEALRYGIPLGGLAPEVVRRELGWLSPRSSLSIGSSAKSGGIIPVSEQGESYLRALYRKAATQLIAAGQIEEAVFVYTELLGDHAEAVSLLEEHKLYRLAAGLAQARNLPAATQVRLWFLAGQLEQALDVARRSGQHLQVYMELKKRKHLEKAREWLWEWALHLVHSNRHAAAIVLLWEHTHKRELLREWLDPALRTGDLWPVEWWACG